MKELETQPNDITAKDVSAKLIIEELDYLFSKINFGASFLDADAIQVMNVINKHIAWLENKKWCKNE